MYIVRWLIGHPLISIWVLGLIAILLAWPGVTNNEKSSAKEHQVEIHSQEKPIESLALNEQKTKNGVLLDNAKSSGLSKAKEESIAHDSSLADTLPQVSEDTVTDLTSTSKEDMLLIAREAYWNNGLDEAAEIYQKLIELEPDVLDHKGELGNVYWRQGYPKKAAELYSEIAIPMISSGKSEPVANMLGFIGLFYPDRAAQINDHLQTKANKAK